MRQILVAVGRPDKCPSGALLAQLSLNNRQDATKDSRGHGVCLTAFYTHYGCWLTLVENVVNYCIKDYEEGSVNPLKIRLATVLF